ncbi:hypothetical protein [Pseudomonas sp. 2835]|uniref:hypothetical protein n=1 Tax=Pseudomonas sp. 2835 TaxID=3156451 RepID=UPI003D1B49B7
MGRLDVSSFFATLTVPGKCLRFGRPIDPKLKVDENNKDIVVVEDGVRRLWVGPGQGGIDVFCKRSEEGFVIRLMAGDHYGKYLGVDTEYSLTACRAEADGEGAGGEIFFMFKEAYERFTQTYINEHDLEDVVALGVRSGSDKRWVVSLGGIALKTYLSEYSIIKNEISDEARDRIQQDALTWGEFAKLTVVRVVQNGLCDFRLAITELNPKDPFA